MQTRWKRRTERRCGEMALGGTPYYSVLDFNRYGSRPLFAWTEAAELCVCLVSTLWKNLMICTESSIM